MKRRDFLRLTGAAAAVEEGFPLPVKLLECRHLPSMY
ncbi:hypothetical protein [Schwartzia succinivorans]